MICRPHSPHPCPSPSPVPLPFGPPLQVLFFQSVLTSHIGSACRSCFSVSTSCLGAPTLIRLSFLLLLSVWATDTVRHPSHQVLLPQGTQGDRNGASHLVFLSEKWVFLMNCVELDDPRGGSSCNHLLTHFGLADGMMEKVTVRRRLECPRNPPCSTISNRNHRCHVAN